LTRILLTGDVEMRINGSFDEVRESFKQALASNGPWELHGPDGRTFVINPSHVLFLEDDYGPSADNGSTQDHRPQQEPVWAR
jgi:hypothetical protein